MAKRSAKKKVRVRKVHVKKPDVKKQTVKGLPDLKPCKPGKYADGLPFNEIQYLECKLILQPNHFTSRKSLFDFVRVMRRPALESKVKLSTEQFVNSPLQIREVLFLDTSDFRFYNNAFILRRRIPYEDGFRWAIRRSCSSSAIRTCRWHERTCGRGSSATTASVQGEALPLKDQLGGIRLLLSHNGEFQLSHVQDSITSLDTLTHVFPPLATLKKSPGENVEMVGATIVEEVLQDIAMLDFGGGTTAKANVALWRARGDHRPLIGEFAFELKFKRRQDLREKALRRAEAFFLALQYAAKDWIALGATKTGVVYRLTGNPPHAHE